MRKMLMAAALAAATGSACACSVVIVGKAASTTGRVLVGHNEDDSGELFVRNALVPARDHAAGTVLPAEKGCAQTVPQVPHTFGFFWSEVKFFKGGVSNADAFCNENGVLVVSDNAAVVPFEDAYTKLTDGGVYYNLRRAIAERAASARDAVNVATNLLMKWGYAAPGRIYTVADRDEAWTIQALKGRRFVARRCPDDGVVVVPNCLTIRQIAADDVVSPSVAAEVAKDPSFDYAKTYQGAKRWRQPNDTLRWKHLYRLAAGVDVGEEYPFSVKPAHKVSPADLQKALSTHYEGTPDEMKPLKHGTDDVERYLPVCRSSTVESLVCVFGEAEKGTELQLAPGSPCENAFRSFRPFPDGLPAELDRSADAVERLERHQAPMTWREYLAEMKRPTARDGVGRFRFANVPELVYYDAPTALEKGSACEVAVVLVHGWGGGLIRADEQAPMAKALAKETKPGVAAPYVIAPLFPRDDLVRKHWGKIDGLAVWNASWCTTNLAVRGSANDDWRGGGDAVGTALSSYDVVDRIFATFADRRLFPNLRRVVLTGFSAGGQFAGRYAAVGKGVVRDGVELAYAAMAPSTEFRFEPDVKWHYGLKDRPRYSAALTEDAILANLSSRRVWRGCGAKDVLGRPFTSLDSCAEAMAQGTNRYDRFQRFEQYLKGHPAWAKQVTFHTFPHIGHKTVIAHSDPAFVDFAINGDNLAAALAGCDEAKDGLVARSDFDVPEGWTPRKIMGKDFRPMLYPGEWACGGTYNDRRAKEIGMWPRPDLPLYRDCALFIYALRTPEGRIEIPNWWKPETWTWVDGKRRGKTGPVALEEFLNGAAESILAENAKPDAPFLLQLSSSRAAFQTDENGTRDVAGYREWKKRHPNFMGFEMLAESENDIGLYSAHVAGVTNRLVRDRLLKNFAPAKDQRGWVDLVRKMWDREKAFHFNETQNWAMAAGCYTHLHLHGLNGAGGLAYEGSASQPLCTWQVAGAFLRGAARQFGNLPFSWYMAHFYSGFQRNGKGRWGENKWCKYPWSTPDKEPKPGDRDYPHCGTSRSLVARQAAYGYFIGASFVCPENDHMLFYDRDKSGKYVPGPYAHDLNDLYVFSTNCTRGAAYATTAVLVPVSERYGHSFRGWGGSYDAKPGWFDDVISQHALYRTLVPIGAKENALRREGFQGALFNSKFGDFWDVLVPDAGQDSAKFRQALAGYKCAFLIGAYRKGELDVAALEQYVRGGGTLFVPSDAVETGLVPSALAGLAFTGRTVASGTTCTDERGVAFDLKDAYAWDVAAPTSARPVVRDDKGAVAIWANGVGRGRIVTVACWRMLPSRYKGLRESLKDLSEATCARYEKDYWEPLLTGERKCGLFEYLFARVQDETLPVKVEGDIHFGVNRTADGWNVWLVNHKGVVHYSLEPEEFDLSKTAHVTVGLRSLAGAKVTDLKTGAAIPAGASFAVDVRPGEWKLVNVRK